MATIEVTPGTGGLRARRLARKMSQQRLAESARCSLSMIRLLESGYEPAGSAVLPRIEEVLNDSRPADEPGANTTSGGLARHDPDY